MFERRNQVRMRMQWDHREEIVDLLEINWGSSVQAHTYRRALDATLKLGNVQEHVKNFRPQMLVLTGNPICRPALVDLATIATLGHSLMICGNVILVSR